MIEVFKIIHIYIATVSPHLPFNTRANTEGKSYKHLNHIFLLWFTKTFFSLHMLQNIWNNLPNSVVNASTVNAFKARLDKFWSHQAVKFDFTTDLTGIRNRSEEVIKW